MPYTNLPGIIGVHLVDEPWEGDPYLPSYHAVRMADPSLLSSLNFPPGYIYASYDAYYNMLSRWARNLDEHGVVSFDDYPFKYNSTAIDENTLLSNFETIRKAAFDTGDSSITVLLPETDTPIANVRPFYWHPTDIQPYADIRQK